MTVDEVAAYLRLPASTVYHFAQTRLLPGFKYSGNKFRSFVEITSRRSEEPTKEVPKPIKLDQTPKEEVSQETPGQPALSDFGLYKCGFCGKMVMGFEKESHIQEKHRGKYVEWKKVR